MWKIIRIGLEALLLVITAYLGYNSYILNHSTRQNLTRVTKWRITQ